MTFDLSGVGVELRGLSDAHRELLADGWESFRSELADPALQATVSYGDSPVPSTFRPKAMRFERTERGARYEMEQGRVDVDMRGRATITLVGAEGGEAWFALMNFLRAALAWTLPRRPAGLIHAASAVVDGRGWLLVGHEGSGKSTWARTAEQGGARVVSDDLSMIDRGRGEWELCDAPFHSTHVVEHRPGRWPLAGLLFPAHGAAGLAPVSTLAARVGWLANLPFLDGALDEPHVATLGEATEAIDCRQLTFSPDPGWLDLLR